MLISCKQASRLISQSLDRKLTLSERLKLRAHLFVCDMCRRFQAHLTMIRISVKRFTHQIEHDESVRLSEEAKQRIARVIESNHP